MGTISVLANLSLDGVMQGPGRADEDTRGGFRHDGWGIGYADEVIAKYVGGMDPAAAMLFGHRSYDDMLGHRTSVTDPNPFTEALVNAPQYVSSRRPGTDLAYLSLHAAGLVDECVLLIHPAVFGSGTRLFGAGERTDLALQETITTTTGVLIARYLTS
ncbi:dihydrofolate reductase family protein [Nonomuraea fuscirosea]|uniref:dihydrofolate reductase family protein n=1 Tax=Nonomuraea fuscirosea TaxID=1291556 RepID=UPI00340442B9